MKARALLLSVMLVGAACPRAAEARGRQAQTGASEALVVVKHEWYKERIAPRPSAAPLFTQEEMVKQSKLEAQAAAARNQDKGMAARAETNVTKNEEAKAKATQTDPPRDGYRYVVKLRNDGAKTVKSIDWDYVFTDPATGQEAGHHQFTSDETIKPGKSKEVSVLYLTPPVKLVSAKALGQKKVTFDEKVIVVRVVYDDGTVWQHP
jgi:hypothetical protein